ncbi:MAG: CoA transferase [Blastocatellia bacterium]|nr:CoA transferase [Blastocatellia bacterium]
MAGPLEGIRVIDFGRFIAAPYCAMLFADMGADVIRVERREGGEDRYLGPVTESGEGGLYINLNRNKRGMTLNPAHPLAREIIRRLISTSDIVIANLPPDVLERLGLDYRSLCAVKEEIIMVQATAFGADGPYRDRVGFDSVAQAMSGAMGLTGFPGPPVRDIVSFMDYGTALHAAFGAMAALFEKQKTGRGRLIEVSLLTTGVTFMLPLLAERAATGTLRAQQGNTSYYTAPSDVYKTSDGWIIVQTIGGPMFGRWARLVGREDLIDDPRCSDDITRADNHEIINRVMSDWCARRTRDEVIRELERARIPCGPVYNLDEVLEDPQVRARRLLEEIEYPGASNPIPLASTPVRSNREAGSIRRRAPTLGEHTDEVLGEFGFSDEEIEEFRRAGAV